MTEEWPDEFNSLSQAAKYAHTCRQAIYVAIRKKQLKAVKKTVLNCRGAIREQWIIQKVDIDEYRKSKHNREKRVFEGEKLFDIENDRWSVLHAAKTISAMLGRHYPAHHIYYLLRKGEIRGCKKGGAWVLNREQLLSLYNREKDLKRFVV